MNARNFAAVAVTAGLLVFAVDTSQAADGPLAQFAGSWSGAGKITVQNGSSERIRCRSSNNASGKAMTLSLRCASDSYKFELASDITSDGSNISGSWNETTRGVVGSLSGRATASNIQATANAVGFNAVAGDPCQRQFSERVDPVARQRNLRSLGFDGQRRALTNS